MENGGCCLQIRCENHLLSDLRSLEDCLVRKSAKPYLSNIVRLEALCTKASREGTGEILIDEEARAYLTARTCSSLIA